MRIVSLNAWGGARFDELTAWVPDVGADVLCLQEVTHTATLDGWTAFDDGERQLPQRASLYRDVRRLLPHHQAWFVASDSGPVRNGDGTVHRQEFGLAVFVHERYPVIGQVSRFVHGSYAEHDRWATSERPRIAQGLRLVDRAGDRSVTVVHAHGLRDAAGKHDTPARARQADRLAALVEDLREPGDHSVVCGDLNVLPDSETITVLAGRGLTELVGDRDTRTSLYGKPVRHANYLFVSHPDAVVGFDVPAQPVVSDHRPLVLDT